MFKSRRTVDQNQKLARLRYVVQVPVPPGGLGEHLSAMHAWALRRCGPGGYLDTTQMGDDRKKPAEKFVQFAFPDAAAARDFARTFAQVGAKAV
jgi:hypothetical protein